MSNSYVHILDNYYIQKRKFGKKKKPNFNPPYMLFPIPFFILPLANDVAHFPETLEGSYACVLQNVLEH